jgi:hypothetical protein
MRGIVTYVQNNTGDNDVRTLEGNDNMELNNEILVK